MQIHVHIHTNWHANIHTELHNMPNTTWCVDRYSVLYHMEMVLHQWRCILTFSPFVAINFSQKISKNDVQTIKLSLNHVHCSVIVVFKLYVIEILLHLWRFDSGQHLHDKMHILFLILYTTAFLSIFRRSNTTHSTVFATPHTIHQFWNKML